MAIKAGIGSQLNQQDMYLMIEAVGRFLEDKGFIKHLKTFPSRMEILSASEIIEAFQAFKRGESKDKISWELMDAYIRVLNHYPVYNASFDEVEYNLILQLYQLHRNKYYTEVYISREQAPWNYFSRLCKDCFHFPKEPQPLIAGLLVGLIEIYPNDVMDLFNQVMDSNDKRPKGFNIDPQHLKGAKDEA